MTEPASEKEKMLAGELYSSNDPQLIAERKRAKSLCARYNQQAGELDRSLLRELFGRETDAYLEPPFYCDYGYNVALGRNVYANHNLVILDCTSVSIGDDAFIGPNVVIATAAHPVDPEIRTSGLEFAKPVRIGNSVWIGAGVIVVPGVEVGDGTTIGAGSVVTKSLPARCVAFGNPCRVVRELP